MKVIGSSNAEENQITNDREQFQKMIEVDREIDRFKKDLESIRPKSIECKSEHDGVVEEQKHKNGYVELDEELDKKVFSHSFDSGLEMPLPSFLFERNFSFEQIKKESTHLMIPNCSSGTASIMEMDTDDEKNDSTMISAEMFSHTKPEAKTKNNKNTIENMELIIKPTFKLNIHESHSNNTVESDDNKQNSNVDFNHGMNDRSIALNSHMSIQINKIHINNYSSTDKIESVDDCNLEQTTEGNNIINALFNEKSNRENFITLQKYFLRWIHFTTIEKLMRRNPEKTRLQKMQAFLQNITYERKKTLNKLRHSNNTNDHRLSIKMQPHQIESPRLLIRKYNNK